MHECRCIPKLVTPFPRVRSVPLLLGSFLSSTRSIHHPHHVQRTVLAHSKRGSIDTGRQQCCSIQHLTHPPYVPSAKMLSLCLHNLQREDLPGLVDPRFPRLDMLDTLKWISR